ncbi:sialic acid TRAP transporter substrate-binding protein SiaP [Parablautia sp. Marseille-Q6255]|uniref:sialic acid TRAP transporter substrate-binding protein SiaP n=1 Tax=Parablautia sp. Marseille-Q6255 TaxID=3039593 RepID=UPI0024BC556E|nr:sialic acid TRAP transporter substrate-binding protein SiaP [Parablautia sp. Marseille-Q6255]
MKKRVLATALAAAMAGSMLAGFTTQAEDLGDPVTLTVTLTAVSTDTHAQAMQEFKKTVEELSGGNITVEVYTDAQLFSQEEEVAAVVMGDADMTLTSASWLTTGSPWVSMFTAGYLFNSYDHMTATLNGEVGQEVFQKISDEQGLLPLGAWYLGSREISLSEDRAIKTPEDLNGVNLRMPNSEAWLFLGEALGANPTPMSFSELYLALQTGAVDGQDNPLGSVESAKFYEVQKSITLTHHLVDSVWPAINTEKWNSLTDAQKDIILQGVEAGRDFCDSTNLQKEEELISFFEEQGLSIYEADIPAFQEHVLNYYLNDEISADWDMEMYDKVAAIGADLGGAVEAESETEAMTE